MQSAKNFARCTMAISDKPVFHCKIHQFVYRTPRNFKRICAIKYYEVEMLNDHQQYYQYFKIFDHFVWNIFWGYTLIRFNLWILFIVNFIDECFCIYFTWKNFPICKFDLHLQFRYIAIVCEFRLEIWIFFSLNYIQSFISEFQSKFVGA